uniref:Small ribosomal subunit protein uS19c n=1 Tax=Euglena longa TaxID=3037 RepID=RR19_EUGLO|nr:ribosomal protein S19 [Euglena longa]P34772.1 RecName: Full=Small ribosomal subunit protein uS19c; AltName: Full=Plastid 30S ribosomal protein S19 [Euglena longa]CAC24597.1 ribosomal protein S19 [Euglena longa]
MSRSSKKSPFISYRLFNTIDKMNLKNLKQLVFTKSRSSTVFPSMVGHNISVYNGKNYVPFLILNQMISSKLGEFSRTRNFRGHKGINKKLIKKSSKKVTKNKKSIKKNIKTTSKKFKK